MDQFEFATQGLGFTSTPNHRQLYAPGSPVVQPADCTAARKNKLVLVHDNLRKALDGLRMIEQHIENSTYHMADPATSPRIPCQGYDSWEEARDDLNEGLKEYRRAIAKMFYPVAFELYGKGNWDQI